jgi:predicted DsbA family dithiol-disulfide isomerase
VKIVWRAFELRPEPVPTLPPGGEYLTRVWHDSVYPLAERLGVTMRLPPVQPRSRRAHEAAKWAASVGRFDEYNGALFRAFFERGEDIGETEVLVSLTHAVTTALPLLEVNLARGDPGEERLADRGDVQRVDDRRQGGEPRLDAPPRLAPTLC